MAKKTNHESKNRTDNTMAKKTNYESKNRTDNTMAKKCSILLQLILFR
jgi:hypothetical protein